MARRRSELLATVAAVVALAAGCGGDDEEESATAWADGVCAAMTTWADSVGSAADSLGDDGSIEERVDAALADVGDATETLRSDLEELGSPDTESGQQAKELVDELASDLQDDVDKIEAAAEDSEGASGTLSAVSVITGTLVTMGEKVASAFEQLEELDPSGELTDAFEQADSCESLTSRS
jgi:hypothetical protein